MRLHSQRWRTQVAEMGGVQTGPSDVLKIGQACALQRFTVGIKKYLVFTVPRGDAAGHRMLSTPQT